MMNFLLALVPAIPPQVRCSRGVGVVYKFVICTIIPEVELELDLRVNIFFTSDESDALQDNRLKNDHPLGVTLPSLYAAQLHEED